MNTTTFNASIRATAPRRAGRSRARTHALHMSAVAVPDRLVSILGFTAASLVALYVVLVVTTIFFAAWQTQLASNVDGAQESISRLESQYYAAMAHIDSTDPSSLGLVAPAKVQYVVATRDTGLTFAGR